MLKPHVAERVRAAMATAKNLHRGAIASLPSFKEDVRTFRKDRAGSVRAEAMQKWLSSEEGKECRKARAALFQVG